MDQETIIMLAWVTVATLLSVVALVNTKID